MSGALAGPQTDTGNEFPNITNISDTLFNNTNLSNVCMSVYSMFFICDKSNLNSKLLSRIRTVSRTDSSSFVTCRTLIVSD